MGSKSWDGKLPQRIASADETSLRAVMLALSNESDDIRDKIDDHLFKISMFNKLKGNTDGSGVKRKALSPVYICRRCGYVFDEDNNKKSCRYHLENSVVDLCSDVWKCWNSNLQGPKNTSENRKDPYFQRGFMYLCCGRHANFWMDTGCRRGYHQAADGKRGNFDIEDPDDETCPSEWYSDELDEDDKDDDDDDDEDEDEEK